MRTRPPRRLLAQLAPSIHVDGVTYQQQWIKPRPSGPWCGPYWYAFFKTPTTAGRRGRVVKGKTRSKYIGKELPDSVVEAFREQADQPAAVMREARREMRRRRRAR
jgi:hypothetical protein